MTETTSTRRRVLRFEVRPTEAAGDPLGARTRRDAKSLNVLPEQVRTARIYFIESPLTDDQAQRLRHELLADPVLETCELGAASTPEGACLIEVHPLPGVMDPAAATVRQAVAALCDVPPDDVAVVTGIRYEVFGVTSAEADLLGQRLLANGVVEAVHREPWLPESFPHGHDHDMLVHEVPLTTLDDDALERLSRDAHLFLSLDEMRAIREAYRALGREPREIELETLAQTWSEHCVHKTLKSTVNGAIDPACDVIDWRGRDGFDFDEAGGRVTIHNLLKSTVAAATHELIADGVDWTLSVFVDNAGIIAFDEDNAICVKVETHNHPSAIEPYGGAATGIGGCIRDIMGTGLAARPIANTDVFCVAHPDHWAAPGLPHEGDARPLPAGCLHPRRVLTRVVDGVRDYGNRMGIPTVSGAVWFDDRYVGNPLVFAGCVGVMPRDCIEGDAQPGDRIIALGGRTGRDGIHGATFSSAELTDSHADEFSHAVQIGNAIEEKRTLDAILRARDDFDRPLYSAITDCGAGGFSSAVGEMGEQLGAEVNLERAPLKYRGLTPVEIWISESQERMVLAVPEANIPKLQAICDEESVELCDLGRFGTDGRELVLRHNGAEVGRMPMEFLHDGIPMPVRVADCRTNHRPDASVEAPTVDIDRTLLELLAHPNIASKHWIIRQYDHEVQGGTVVKPLTGPGDGPSDASVMDPVPGSGRGLAISCGLATGMGDASLGGDPYLMTLAAIDEVVRNLVCVGADPDRIAILDNFCWPSCAKPENLGTLVRAAVACYDGAMAYRTPFVSGKDSLNNQFKTEDGRTIEIPPTLLVTGVGVVPSIDACVTMDLKRSGSSLVLVGPTTDALGGSHLLAMRNDRGVTPRVDLQAGPRRARAVAAAISSGRVLSAHDCSDGGALVAIAEMMIGAGDLGVRIDAGAFVGDLPSAAACFGETPSRYLLEIAPDHLDDAMAMLADADAVIIGEVTDRPRLVMDKLDLPLDQLRTAWLGTLDW